MHGCATPRPPPPCARSVHCCQGLGAPCPPTAAAPWRPHPWSSQLAGIQPIERRTVGADFQAPSQVVAPAAVPPTGPPPPGPASGTTPATWDRNVAIPCPVTAVHLRSPVAQNFSKTRPHRFAYSRSAKDVAHAERASAINKSNYFFFKLYMPMYSVSSS